MHANNKLFIYNTDSESDQDNSQNTIKKQVFEPSQTIKKLSFYVESDQDQTQRQQKIINAGLKRKLKHNRGVGKMQENKSIKKNLLMHQNQENVNYDQIIQFNAINLEPQKKIAYKEQQMNANEDKNGLIIPIKYQIKEEQQYDRYETISNKCHHSQCNQQQQQLNPQEEQVKPLQDQQKDHQENKNSQNKNINVQGQKRVRDYDRQFFIPQNNQIQLSLKYAIQVSQRSNQFNIYQFLISPIPQNIRLQFQIHRFKNFMDNTYQMWFCVGKYLNKLLYGQSKSINIENTIYHIFLSIQEKKMISIGKIVSNFKRSEYTLFDHTQKQVRIMGTSCFKYSIQQVQRMELYTPKATNEYKSRNIYQNTVSNSLKELYEMKYTKQQIERYRSIQINAKCWQLMSSISFQPSKRNIILINTQQRIKIVLGKLSTNRYKIICGSGVAPIQVFALAIAHLQQ